MADGEPEADQLALLLDYLRRSRGLDFSRYRPPTLWRRIAKRMHQVGIESFSEYVDYLEVHPEEYSRLFDTILINVTSFFRDPEAWDVLTQRIVPVIVASKREGEPIRVWSAGCSSGEEAFTLAMVWAEALGLDQFRQRVKIYATDIDEDALTKARQATYEAAQLEPVPDELRSRYFERAGPRYAFRADLRRAIVFGRHDLIQDSPISHLDLLVCRNTLIYLNAETQGRILARFHFALTDMGFLFLGKAEMLLTHTNLFRPVDMKHRIFSKAAQVDLRDRLLALAETGDLEAAARLAKSVRLGEEVFSSMPSAQIVVGRDGVLLLANRQARATFGLGPKDLGRPFQEIELSYKPLELRSLIQKVQSEQAPLTVAGVEQTLPGNEVHYLDVQLAPLKDQEGAVLGVSVIFEDTTRVRRTQAELQQATDELQTAYEELQSSNEELVTTNEELQSTVEELQTTNEELQSTNEEHETMNEELHATNEELETLNEQLRGRTEEVNQANALLESILAGLASGAVVVDRNLNVLTWNPKAQDLWGLRPDEVRGKSLTQLDIGLPVGQLIEPLRACLDGDGSRDIPTLTLDATDRRGRKVSCRITCSPLVSAGQVQGVTLLMDPQS
ncbi:MAG: PAS domain-containing protein [Candidatus Rokubacteria bacterium]|nr:PAS domain-containing protein [Candidatus Rokubacteria bacterium]